jgi:hypothetical protein
LDCLQDAAEEGITEEELDAFTGGDLFTYLAGEMYEARNWDDEGTDAVTRKQFGMHFWKDANNESNQSSIKRYPTR